MMSSAIGEVQDIKKTEYVFEWRISDFFSLSEEKYSSPTFNFDGKTWHLIIYPNMDFFSGECPYISLFLRGKLTGPKEKVFLSFALKSEKGKKHYEHQFDGFFKNSPDGIRNFLKRSKLLEKKSILVPSGILTVVCTIFDCSSCTEYADYRTGQCSYCKEWFNISHLPIHEEKCLNIRCSTCNHKWDDHECSKLKEKGSEVTAQHSLAFSGNKTLRDFKEFFLSQEHCDVTLKVNEQEFRAHKAILCARSSVFSSAFRHDMKEKATGTVNIEDCDPACFRDFLCFLYCGDVENLSTDNVFGLFAAADKYDVQELRSQCLEFMKNNLSVDAFCDTLTLALQHSEKEIIDLLADFLSRHMKDVIVTPKWKTFLHNNTTEGNEILIKALSCNGKC